MTAFGRMLARVFGPGELPGDRRYREATERWQRFNARQRAAGCPCGRPGTKVRYDHGNVGAVPVEWWTCEEHEGATAWSGTGGNLQPAWPRTTPCDTCTRYCARSGPIDGPPNTWYCPRGRATQSRQWEQAYLPEVTP